MCGLFGRLLQPRLVRPAAPSRWRGLIDHLTPQPHNWVRGLHKWRFLLKLGVPGVLGLL